MFTEQLVGNLIQGLVLGSICGVATMGRSMIFGVRPVVNVEHGAFIMVGAFTALTLFTKLVMNQGAKPVDTTTAADLSRPEVIEAYLGRAPE